MTVGILQKAVDELNKDKPRLDYIRGLLETLIELQPKALVQQQQPIQAPQIRAPIRIGPTGTLKDIPSPNTMVE